MATTIGPRHYTYADLDRVPADRKRYEIIGGDLFVSPSPSVAHQEIVLRLGIQLSAFAGISAGKAFVAPLDVVFADDDVVEPDVIFVGADRLGIIAEKNLRGAPSLVIEVLSPSSYDTDPGEKLALYARYGVPEYWIVDPRTHTIVAHANPKNGHYLRHETAHSGCMPSLTLEGLTLTVL